MLTFAKRNTGMIKQKTNHLSTKGRSGGTGYFLLVDSR